MIVGCYSLDLYCENEDSPLHTYREFPHQYTGVDGPQCNQQARRHGWKLDLQNQTAICPKCAKKKKETTHAQ